MVAPVWVSEWSPRAHALLRIVAAYLFLLHGTSKLFKVPHVAMFDNLQLMSLSGLAGVLEVVGGVLLLIGLFTRPVAFILSGQMAVAYFMFHAPSNFYPVLNGGEPAILFAFIFLLLSTTGAGAYSLDGLRTSRTRLAHAVA